MELYNRIISLCQKNGLTGAEMCKSAGIKSPNVLTALKMGRAKSLSTQTLDKIADFFGVSVQYLLYGEEPVGVKIPVYGVIAAGVPILAEQEIIDYVDIPYQWAKLGEMFGLQVRGDSMEPRLFSGDTVVLQKTDEFVNNKICAVMVNGEEATLKRVQVRANGITLLPFNQNYQPINFTADQVQKLPVRCLGVVIGMITDML